MDYPHSNNTFTTGKGDFTGPDQYAPPPHGAIHTSDARQAGDSHMDELFDFQGYQGALQTETVAPYLQHELPADYQQYGYPQHDGFGDRSQPDVYQQYSAPQQDGFMKSSQPEEVDDDDGWRNLFDSAVANYYACNPLRSHLIPMQPSSYDEDLFDPPGSGYMPELDTLAKPEKWDIDKTTMEFMASLLALSAPAETLSARCGLRACLRDVKLEEPILQSDAATDMLRLRERNIVRLTPKGIKSFPLDKRHDQDLPWSSKSLKLPNDMDKLIAAEKMAVNIETGNFLKEVFEDMKGDLMTSVSVDRQRKALIRPMTPPLLPLSPPYSPGRIPSPAAELPFTSTPEDLLAREAAELENRIMIEDDTEEIEPDGLQPEDVYSPLKTTAKSSSSPLRRKLSKISNLKMSSPLLPFEPNEPPTKKTKTVSFAEELHTLVPLRDTDNVSTDPFDAADEALAVVAAMVEPLAQSAMEKVINERLIEIDTTARVNVPPIGDIEPTPPWETYSGRHRALLKDCKGGISKSEKKWSGASSLERLLPWSPFPAHLGKPKPEGDFDDGSLARYLAELDIEGNVDLGTMVWKLEGLRILDSDDEDEDEDELSVYNYETHENSGYDRPPQVAQVANMRLREPTRSLHFPRQQPPRDTNRGATATEAVNTLHRPETDLQVSRTAVPLIAEPEVSSMQALLEKRKKQLQREKAALDANSLSKISRSVTEEADQASNTKQAEVSVSNGTLSAFLAVQGVRAMPEKEAPKARTADPTATSKHAESVLIETEPRLDIPAPEIIVPRSEVPIVVASAVMANRQLIRKLQQCIPTLNMIERESTPVDGKQVDPISPAREADLTVSSSTGLMFTTLQKLKQRPLPGQEASFVGIQEQIAMVAVRYDRLIVLLSEGSNSTTEAQTHIRALDERDSAAIADLIGFFSRLDTEVQVSFVPGGDDELVKWIAAAVTRNAHCIEGFTLLDEETVWERFLRKAGMNVFAAQVVLDQLKQHPSQYENEDYTIPPPPSASWLGFEGYGLAAFVGMDVEQRVQRFGPHIGGERMLRRVSMSLDGLWKVGAKRR